MQNNTPEIIDKMNNACLPANIDADKMLQKVIQLLKTREGAKISSLPAIWLEKCNTFSVDQRNHLNMDERFVFPVNLRPSIMSSIDYGHPGRGTMLRYVVNILWPKIQR